MNENEKFIVRISCDPKIEPTDIGAKIVDKMLALRVEKVNESVISQLKDLMKEKGINELYVIDESKVLEMVKKSQAFDIIKNKGVNVGNFKDMLEDWEDITYQNYLRYRVENGYELQSDYDFETNPLTEEEFIGLKEVLVCH